MGYGETAQDEGGVGVSEWEDERDAGSLGMGGVDEGMGGVDEGKQLGDRRVGGYEERRRRDGHSVGHTARGLLLLLLRRSRLIVTETE